MGNAVPEVCVGMVRAEVTIFSPDSERRDRVTLLVDTGSVLTWVSEDVLFRLGLRPTDIRHFRTVNGTIVERPVCDAVVECEGLRGAVGLVFAKPTDGQLLGVTALERLGLTVDPITGTLKKEDAFLAVSAA